MNETALWPSLLGVAGLLISTTSLGWFLAGSLLPRGPGWALERWGWSAGAAALLIGFHVCASFALHVHPGWPSFLTLCAIGLFLSRRFVLPWSGRPSRGPRGWTLVSSLLLLLTAAGVFIYSVRSLGEPMWPNDFLAIWGLKGKTIFADAALPQRLFRWPEFDFSNPAYPIGLPLLYAGIAFLLGRWDDHAMALLFPFFQIGTLLVLVGWLRRRGASTEVALAGAALVANFGLLYASSLTGLAEVPAAFAFLLVGTAFCDALDETDPGARRRLFLAACLAASVKNEGLFLLGTAALLLLIRCAVRRKGPVWTTAAAIVIPGLGSFLLHRLVLGSHPLRGLDFALLWKPGLSARLAETIREELTQLVRPAWPALAALLLLTALMRRNPAGIRILLLVSVSLATYLVLPALCTFGPGWLVHWTVVRISAALFPLLMAGIGTGWSSDPLRVPAYG